MAIAGSAVPAVRIERNPDGSLTIGQSVMVQRELACSVDDALDGLILSDVVFLKLYGDNLAALKRRWQREMVG